MPTVFIDTEVKVELEDFIDEFNTDDLITEIESRGRTVLDESTEQKRGVAPQTLFESLCEQFGLPRAATSKQELLRHINSLL